MRSALLAATAALLALALPALALPAQARADDPPPPDLAPASAPPAPVPSAPVPPAPVPVAMDPAPPDLAPLPPPRPGRVTLAVGPRLLVVPSAGFDPYSTNDALVQLAISGGLTLFRGGSTSLVASLEWDFGGKAASARGQDASLFVHRLAGALEARYQPASRLMLFVKLAPGAVRLLGSIADPASSDRLLARAWTWDLEATGGVGFLFGRAAGAQFWLTGEGGYAFAGEAQMAYARAADEEDPRRYGATMLPPLKLAGGVGKLGVAVSF